MSEMFSIVLALYPEGGGIGRCDVLAVVDSRPAAMELVSQFRAQLETCQAAYESVARGERSEHEVWKALRGERCEEIVLAARASTLGRADLALRVLGAPALTAAEALEKGAVGVRPGWARESAEELARSVEGLWRRSRAEFGSL